MMLGGAVTGAPVDGFRCDVAGSARRHLRALRHRATKLGFVIAILAGMIVAAAAVVAAKQFVKPAAANAEAELAAA